jgi:hypothetical protein
MPEHEIISMKTTRCRKCGARIERSNHLVKSKKVLFLCSPCEDEYHRKYSLRSYYQKKALREDVENMRVTEVRWGSGVRAIATWQ